MAVATEEKKVDPKKLDFCNLDELPRGSGLALEDLGIGRNEYLTLCSRMAAGDADAAKRLDVVREVLFECMKRDIESRLILDDFGQIPTREERNDAGQKIKVPVKEWETVSRWAVRDNGDTWIGGDGPARVRPKRGHWKRYVEEHWQYLAPLLKFRNPDARAPRDDPAANPEAYREAVKWSLDDKNPDRINLKSWLVPFLKAGKPSDWTGE